MNRYKEIDAVLFVVSLCLKDILDYELSGFVKNGEAFERGIFFPPPSS